MAKSRIFKKYILPIVAVLLIVIFVLPMAFVYLYFFVGIPGIFLYDMVFHASTPPKVSAEESMRNFPVYEERLTTVAQNNGYELEQDLDSLLSSSENRNVYNIEISEDENLRVSFSNSGDYELFSVIYECNNSKTEHEFNVDLFIDLVNCLWEKTLTKKHCTKFLEAPEWKYQDSGNERINGELLSKRDSDFWESYAFRYRISKDNVATLSISGRTNRPEK